jgi:hypothetical protein
VRKVARETVDVSMQRMEEIAVTVLAVGVSNMTTLPVPNDGGTAETRH